MSRRKQAKPRALKRDEAEVDGIGSLSLNRFQNAVIDDEEDEEEEEVEDLVISRSSFDGEQGRVSPFAGEEEEEDAEEETEDEEEDWCSSRSSSSEAMPPTDGEVACAKSSDSVAAAAANSAVSAPYTCAFCQRSFPRMSLLKKHEQAHSDEMPFRCDYCMRLFKHKRSRDRHVKLHTGDKKYRCEHCEAAFSRSDHLKIHIKTHDTRKPFQCNVCQRGYSTAAALTSHMLNHRRESGSRCGSLCSASPASSTSSTTSESLTPCPSLPSPLSSPATPPARETQPQTQQQTQQIAQSTCDKRNKQQQVPTDDSTKAGMGVSKDSVDVSSSKSEYGAADKRSTSAGGTEGSFRTASESSKAAVSTNSRQIVLNCPYCAKESFSSVEALGLHVQTLHGPMASFLPGAPFALFTCQLCSMQFSSVPALQQHTLSSHSLGDVLKLYCQAPQLPPAALPTLPEPPQSFPTDLSCRRKRSISSSDKARDAPDEKTSRLGDIRAAPDELLINRLMCQHCGAAFSENDKYESHVAKHLMTTTVEYGCQSCSKAFPTPDELQKHLMDSHAHHLYRCSLCDEMFDSKVAIQVHFAVQHSDECKQFQCTVCASIFRAEVEFLSHVKTNHMSRPVVALRCPVCPETFAVEFLRERHVQLVHSHLAAVARDKEAWAPEGHDDKPAAPELPSALNLSLHCAYCGELCKSRLELESHMKNHHPSNSSFSGRLKCNICDEIFPTANILAEHKLTHCKVIGAAQCATCRTAIKTEEEYYSHVQQHYDNQTPPIPCIVCRQTLSHTVEVELHAKFHTKSHEPLYPCCVCRKQQESQNLIASGMAPGGFQTFVCKECFHARNQLLVQSAFCLQQQQQTQTQQPRSYQCIKCQQVFLTEQEIQAHVSTHLTNEGAMLDCRLCKTTHETPLKLQAHLIEHTFAGCSGFTCYLCGSVFTAAAGLQRHIFEHGLSARPYDCTQCHLKFFFRAELENHVLGHERTSGETEKNSAPSSEGEGEEEEEEDDEEEEVDEEEEEEAESCSSEATEISLSDAQKAAEAIPEEIPTEAKADGANQFRCDRCDKSFPCLSNLQGHVRIHTQGVRFTCPTCGKEFALSRNLHIHMRSHSGEKPYECPVCHKRFARKENRKAHLKLHSGVKPFACGTCGRAFSRKCHLREHLRTHAESVQRKTKTDANNPACVKETSASLVKT